jgi:cytochrome c-type biogenesis protein CcmH/NrfG
VYITAGLAAGAAGRLSAAPSAPAETPAFLSGSPSPLVQAPTPPDGSSPDDLYRHREDPRSAAEAATAWEARLRANPADYESAWKLARARHWLGDHAAGTEAAAAYEAGVAAARTAVALRPNEPEGHFWLGANLAGLAQRGGVMSGLHYRGQIRQSFETVLRLDPGFDKGAAYCALSAYYRQVPRLFGGSKTKAETLARQCLAYDNTNTLALFFLAQALTDLGREAEARAELQRVLDAPLDPEHIPEGKEWKSRAAALLDRRSR